MAPRKRKTTEEDATAAITGGADDAPAVGAVVGRAPRRSPRMRNNSDGAGTVAELTKEKPVKKRRAKKEKAAEEEVADEDAAEAEEEEVGNVAEKPAAKGKPVKKGRGKKAKTEENDEAAEENPAAAVVKEKPAKKGRGKKAKVAEKAVDEEVAEKDGTEVGDAVAEEKDEVTADGDSSEAEEEEVAKKKVGHVSKTIVIEHCKQCNSFKTRANMVKEGLEKAINGITVLVNPEKQRRGCFEIREEGGETFISLLDMKRPFKPMKDLDMQKVISDIIEKIK